MTKAKYKQLWKMTNQMRKALKAALIDDRHENSVRHYAYHILNQADARNENDTDFVCEDID